MIKSSALLSIYLILPAVPAVYAAAHAIPPGVKAEAGTLETQYAAQLKSLQAEIAESLPAVPEQRKAAFLDAREAVKNAKAAVTAAQQPLDKLGTAAALVDHAKGKWLGGAEKGIANAQAMLKKASSDAEREAANKELARWQADKEAGLKALKERQAALDAAMADEAKNVEAKKMAQAALADAEAKEMHSAKALLTDVNSFLSSHKLDAKLVECAVLANATPRGLAEYARQGKEQEALIQKLLSDTALMRAMLEAGGPKDSKYGQAAQILAAIHKESPRAKDGVLQRLAIATCLEHAVPVKQANPKADTAAPPVVDPVKRYLHFEKASLAGELDPAFKHMSAWELRNVVNGDESDETLAWGREMLRNYRPDHVLNPDYGWRYSKAVTTDVRYGSQDVKNDAPSLQPYQNIIRNGGVCGRRAFFGRFILRSFGIPTVARPQVGHAALAHWAPNGWVINLGAGWGTPEAKGVMEMTDADFVLETQVRKSPAEHAKALRAQWAADALGEPKYVSMKPDTGGLWSLLALYQKKAVAADAKAAPPAALGQELGEANESAEVRARALVKAELTEADRKTVVDSNGVITIPAGACSGGQIVGSFLGGHQLFSGGGVITCDVEVAGAGVYGLTARVVTVQDNPGLQLALNGGKVSAEIAVPYTMGQWQHTEPVRVSLDKGRNALRFTRPEGSRGLTIREFTLTPVK
jgi:hypothetical protein